MRVLFRSPALVVHAVEVMVGVAVALQQAESAGAVVEEGGGDYPLGVVERPPDALAAAGPQREAVGIVDLRAPVHAVGPVAFGVKVHRGERREAAALDRLAQEEGFFEDRKSDL